MSNSKWDKVADFIMMKFVPVWILTTLVIISICVGALICNSDDIRTASLCTANVKNIELDVRQECYGADVLSVGTELCEAFIEYRGEVPKGCWDE